MSSPSALELLPSPSKRVKLEGPEQSTVQNAACDPEEARVEDSPQEIWVSLNMSWAGKSFSVDIAESDRYAMSRVLNCYLFSLNLCMRKSTGPERQTILSHVRTRGASKNPGLGEREASAG